MSKLEVIHQVDQVVKDALSDVFDTAFDQGKIRQNESDIDIACQTVKSYAKNNLGLSDDKINELIEKLQDAMELKEDGPSNTSYIKKRYKTR